MDEDRIGQIAAWLASAGLAGKSEMALLRGFAERCRAAGIALTRAVALIDTLHPTYEGRAFRWRSDGVEEPVVECGPSGQGEAAAAWRRTAFYHLYTTGAGEVRRRIGFGEPADFRYLPELKDAGYTDYVAMFQRFAAGGVIARWTASTRTGRPITRRDLATRTSPRSGGSFRTWPSPSSARPSRGSPGRWSTSTSAATRDAASSAAASPGRGRDHPRRPLVLGPPRIHGHHRIGASCL